MFFKVLRRRSVVLEKKKIATPSSESQKRCLLILSHNVGQDLPDFNDLDGLLCSIKADIVLLQEITRDYVDRHWAKLSQVYRYLYYGPFLEKKHVASGILSKHPIIKVDDFKLAESGIVLQQRALIDIEGKAVAVYNIHLTFPRIVIGRDPFLSSIPWPRYDCHARREEMNNLTMQIVEECNPVIAAGDFNLTSWSHDYKKLTRVVTDAYRSSEKWIGFSWPANRTPSLYIPLATPLVRIDYLFHSAIFQAQSAQFLAKTGSDHLPLLVEIVMNN